MIVENLSADAAEDLNEYLAAKGLAGTVQIMEKETEEIAAPVIEVGSSVRLNQGAKYYDGKQPASFVYNRDHLVKSIGGDRVVITFNGITVGAVHMADLTLVE